MLWGLYSLFDYSLLTTSKDMIRRVVSIFFFVLRKTSCTSVSPKEWCVQDCAEF